LVHTGDRGYLDEDGYLSFVDRKKEAIRRRGENISAYEVEMLVAKHPKVLEVAAIAVSSELSEDEVMVYIVPEPGEPPRHEEIIQFCSDNMAYFMVPRFVEFIDALPKTASEKIEKYKLRRGRRSVAPSFGIGRSPESFCDADRAAGSSANDVLARTAPRRVNS